MSDFDEFERQLTENKQGECRDVTLMCKVINNNRFCIAEHLSWSTCYDRITFMPDS